MEVDIALVRWLRRLLLALPLLAPAAVRAAAPEPIPVQGNEYALAVAPRAEVLADPGGRLDLDAVSRLAGWQRTDGEAFSFGYDPAVRWVRWQLQNATDRALPLVLDLGSPRQDHVEWFVQHADGSLLHERGGDSEQFALRSIRVRKPVLPLTLAPHERVAVYLRLSTQDGLYETLPVTLYGGAEFGSAIGLQNLLLTLYHGGLLTLALYNLLLFAATRERAFGYYVAYIGSFLVWNLTFSGFSLQYLWPQHPALNNPMQALTGSASFAGFGLFAYAYLRLREAVPRGWLRLNALLIGLSAVSFVPALYGHYAVSIAAMTAAGCLLMLLNLGFGVRALLAGSRQARFFVSSFALLMFCVTAYLLQVFKLFPANSVTDWGMQIGSAIEALLLALGLADLMNTLKAQAVDAERRALEAQQALNTRLEQQVSERTQELERANRRLGELAITDALTGTFNRRHFNDFCAATLRSAMPGRTIALCMFDIDRFKAFNDRYGHQAGDEALRDVAAAVQAELRRTGDALFRLGGEEFGLLFSSPSAEAAAAFAERLREAVQGLGRRHAENLPGIVTASFGVGCWHWDATPPTLEKLYALADGALYRAKQDGRNRVHLECLPPRAAAVPA